MSERLQALQIRTLPSYFNLGNCDVQPRGFTLQSYESFATGPRFCQTGPKVLLLEIQARDRGSGEPLVIDDSLANVK